MICKLFFVVIFLNETEDIPLNTVKCFKLFLYKSDNLTLAIFVYIVYS